MTIGLILLAGLAGASVPAAGAPAVAAVPASPDWTQQVEVTEEGGYRMGNPDAPLKLVEFLSTTCGHCADFAEAAMPALREQVRAGRISIEYRNYVLNHYDVAAAMLSRCAPTSRYFELTDALLARQDEWVGKAERLTPAQRARIEVQPTRDSVALTWDLLGLTPIAGAYGITASTCLADNRRLAQLFGMAEAAERLGVQGTPTFMLNGRVIGAHDWSTLQPYLGQP